MHTGRINHLIGINPSPCGTLLNVILYGSYARGNYVLWDSKIELYGKDCFISKFDKFEIRKNFVRRSLKRKQLQNLVTA